MPLAVRLVNLLAIGSSVNSILRVGVDRCLKVGLVSVALSSRH
jgi:hypothetical protein